MRGMTNNLSAGGAALGVNKDDRSRVDSLPEAGLTLCLDMTQVELKVSCTLCRTESFVLSGSCLGVSFAGPIEPAEGAKVLERYIRIRNR